jgi:DMSO/TMAO reductase YedYZ molybdopterin-dependent catalytic subunit
MENDIVLSPDTQRNNRIPPGQHVIEEWPVLHHGQVHHIDSLNWNLRLFGLVDNERTLSYSELTELPQIKVLSDIHCVTSWSRLNNLWEGIASLQIKKLVEISSDAKFVIVHAAVNFTTNLSILDFFQPDVLLAVKHDGDKLSANHGGPVRLVIPRLYFWKSAKWITGLEFTASDQPGFWESNGYNNHGDPWKEERYG